MVAASSPTRRRGSILKEAPSSSPTCISGLGGLSLAEEALRGKRYGERLTCREAVAMGRERRDGRRRRAVGRREDWRVAMFCLGCVGGGVEQGNCSVVVELYND
jgi:hypothetical protein